MISQNNIFEKKLNLYIFIVIIISISLFKRQHTFLILYSEAKYFSECFHTYTNRTNKYSILVISIESLDGRSRVAQRHPQNAVGPLQLKLSVTMRV